MNLKKLSLLTFSALLLGACTQTLTPTTSTPPVTEEEPINAEVTATSSAYTLADVATHNTPDNCWIVIDNQIYDVSNYATKHPGGEAVYQGCGQDATEMFNTRPMGSGTPHSDKARSYLKNFFLAPLSP